MSWAVGKVSSRAARMLLMWLAWYAMNSCKNIKTVRNIELRKYKHFITSISATTCTVVTCENGNTEIPLHLEQNRKYKRCYTITAAVEHLQQHTIWTSATTRINSNRMNTINNKNSSNIMILLKRELLQKWPCCNKKRAIEFWCTYQEKFYIYNKWK